MTSLIQVLNQHLLTVFQVMYFLLALHFPFVFPEIQPQAPIPQCVGVVIAAVGFSLSVHRAPHSQAFPLRSHPSLPKASKCYMCLWYYLQTSTTV